MTTDLMLVEDHLSSLLNKNIVISFQGTNDGKQIHSGVLHENLDSILLTKFHITENILYLQSQSMVTYPIDLSEISYVEMLDGVVRLMRTDWWSFDLYQV